MIELTYQGAQMHIDQTGAEMRRYRGADGRDYLWSGDPDVWKGVAPILFPAIGALKDGGATIGGTFYAVPRHGFVRERPFAISEQGEDFVTLTLHEDAQTRQVFPFDFALSVTYRFLPNGFETRFTVENHSGREMPFMIGGHPAFRCPLNEGERFEDYVVRFAKPESGVYSLVEGGRISGRTETAPLGEDGRTLALDHAAFDRLDTYIFEDIQSRSVELVHRETGRGIRFSFDMDVLAIWTMPEKNGRYVCLEPWQGCPAYASETGRFEAKPHHVALGVGRAYSCG